MKMKLTPEILLKHADGNLEPSEAAEVEALLQNDANARDTLALIQLSGRSISEMGVSADEGNAANALKARLLSGEREPGNGYEPFGANSSGQLAGDLRSTNTAKPNRLWELGKIAAAVIVLLTGIYAGYVAGIGSISSEDLTMARQPVWVVRVVDYHTLYDRETVSGSLANSRTIGNLEQQFSSLMSQQVSIPDLGENGLEFRRGQVLKFEGEEIIQLVYLPNQSGKPVALCLRHSPGENTQPDFATLRGLAVMRWRQDGLEYIFLGEQSEAQIASSTILARQMLGHV